MDEVRDFILGRNPSVPDERNYPLTAFLGATPPTKLEATYAALMASRTSKAMKAWATEAMTLLRPFDVDPPVPPPVPVGTQLWGTDSQLDQGNTGHCVGFAWAQFGNTLPIDSGMLNPDGHAIYYEAKVTEGQAGAENGSSIHAGASAMRNRGRISAYAWASNSLDIEQWLLMNGPVVVGTDWYAGMFNPDANGIVHPTGGVQGGHAYIAVGYETSTDLLTFQNSWGPGWGQNGFFKMSGSEFATVFSAQGEGCVAVELATS